MNALTQAASFAEGQSLMAEEAAKQQQDHIQELAAEVIDSDLVLQYGTSSEINGTTVAEKLIDMCFEGEHKFLPEDIASAALAATTDTTSGVMPLRDSMYKAAVALISTNYEAIIQTINEHAA